MPRPFPPKSLLASVLRRSLGGARSRALLVLVVAQVGGDLGRHFLSELLRVDPQRRPLLFCQAGHLPCLWCPAPRTLRLAIVNRSVVVWNDAHKP